MSKNINDLFIWKDYRGFSNKDSSKNNEKDLEYWQTRTVKAADNAMKHAFTNANNVSDNCSSLVDETVYSEAKNLVKGWLTNKKVYGGYNDRQSFLQLSDEECDINIPSRSEIHKEWEHLVNRIESKEDYKEEINSYLCDDNVNDAREDKKLKSVISNLHKKTFVDSSKLHKIDSYKSIDMKKRIENRQEEVKRKREERLRNEELIKVDKLAQKEARIEALKMLKEERKLKEISIKKEEELLQIEMNKIRVELQRKREQEQIELKRLKETKELLEKDEKKSHSSRQMEERSKAIEGKISKTISDRFEMISEFVDRKFLNKNVQLVRKCFLSWKEQITDINIEMEKAKVWFDFKISRKVFRTWRQYCRNSKINLRIEMDQQKIKLLQMKESMASDFRKRNLLKKCIIYWSLYVIDEKETRWCQKLEEMRKRKMIAYIETLQEKAMENHEKIEILTLESKKNKEIHDNSCDPYVHYQSFETARPTNSIIKIQQNPSHCKSARPSERNQKCKEAWQITKKDVYLPIETSTNIPDSYRRPSDTPQMKSLKPPKIVNSFANRDAVQKEIIRQQQTKIKEQQQLLEEIKCNQFLQKIKQDPFLNNLESTKETQNMMTPMEVNITESENGSESTKSQESKNRNKFVIQMEHRAKEREKIKAERLEKQKKIEEEKQKQLIEKLAEQSKLEMEEKVKRDKLIKEKKEKDRQKEEAKQKRIKLEYEMNEKADEFRNKQLLKHYGIKTWYKLLSIRDINKEKAENLYCLSLLSKTFHSWKKDIDNEMQQQTKIIKIFYDQILLRRCFHHMKLFKHRYQLMELCADNHYLHCLVHKYFILWRLINHRQTIRIDKLIIQSDHLYQRSLIKNSFVVWRQLPMAKKVEREREKRKDAMRQKVVSIIPDFQPNHFL